MSTPTVLDEDGVRTQSRPACCACGAPPVRVRYADLTDRLFSVGGKWSLVECSDPACGMLWLDPAPVVEDLPKLYRQYYTHEREPLRHWSRLNRVFRRAENAYLAENYGYGEVRGTWCARLQAGLMYLRPSRRATLDSDVFYLSAQLGARLLEVGCGSGAMLNRMQERGWRVEGIDFDSAAVTQARDLGLQVRVGDILKMDLTSGTYDVVVMSHVIEHVPDPQSLLHECWRLLRPGGRLVVVTPNNRALSRRLFGRYWMPLDPPRHLALFTVSALKRLSEDAGFGVETLRTTARGASGVLEASVSIRLKGRYIMGQRPSSPLRLLGDIWQRLVSVAVLFVSGWGEEIIYIGRKPHS